jgi:hypothetical protein
VVPRPAGQTVTYVTRTQCVIHTVELQEALYITISPRVYLAITPTLLSQSLSFIWLALHCVEGCGRCWWHLNAL